MNARIASLLAVLLAAGCAPDTDGDLKKLVAVEGAGSEARFTFYGVGIGASRDDMVAAFGDTLGIPGDGAFLGKFKGDFGTKLDVLTNVKAGRVDQIYLTYEGNPVAVRKVFERWREVFVSAGSDCTVDSTSCEMLNGSGQRVNDVVRFDRWWGPAEVMVTIQQ